MASTSITPPTLALGASFLISGYLTYRCWLPPNPHPSASTDRATNPLPKDKIAMSSKAVQIRRLTGLCLWIAHAAVTLFYPAPPTLLCPNSNNLSSSLFTWTPYSAAVVAAIMLAAPIRLLAFKHLGENFTFRLAKPKRLVTTGLYAYVQHPSYPTNWILMAANIAMLLRLDGVLGCVLPTWVVRFGMGSTGIGPWSVLLVVFSILGAFGVWIRVKDEEAMLKKEFGKDWEEYHWRTGRFIPGVF